MDPAQFKEYTDGMAVLETTRTHRRHHEQCKQALIRQTTPCDGTSPAGVRAWFEDIELAGVENQIEMASRTAAGSLRWELERYIAGVLATNDQINARFNVPWADVKAHLRTLFLNVDESSALRDEVDPAKCLRTGSKLQPPEVADPAYPGEGRNEDQNRDSDPRFCQGAAQRRTRKKAGGREQPYHAGRGRHWLQCQEGHIRAVESA